MFALELATQYRGLVTVAGSDLFTQNTPFKQTNCTQALLCYFFSFSSFFFCLFVLSTIHIKESVNNFFSPDPNIDSKLLT